MNIPQSTTEGLYSGWLCGIAHFPHGTHLSAKSAEAAARLGSQATLRSQNMGRLGRLGRLGVARMLKGKTGLLMTRQQIDSSGFWCCPHCVVDVFAGHRYMASGCLSFSCPSVCCCFCTLLTVFLVYQCFWLWQKMLVCSPMLHSYFNHSVSRRISLSGLLNILNSCREFIQGKTLRL